MTVPGAKPKFATVNVGHADIHGGHGYAGAVIDDYPIRFGLIRKSRPSGTDGQDVKPDRRPRRYYGEEKK